MTSDGKGRRRAGLVLATVLARYCHSGFEVKDQPEYVFALNPDNPRLGLFVPFYVHFLEQWSDARHARYDFENRELVYSDERGREVRRTRFASVETSV